ncbi:MAG: ATP-dependent Clp protease ATP-binding subunit [Oscillospiraceae bacterium]|nr:ATP-dependent Clp protease ATP-binding subunit [Oscillospiraceae bacterium]
MFRFSGFTQKANNAINVAISQASALGHTYVGSEHLVLGMLDEGSGVAYTVLTQKNLSFESYRTQIIQNVGRGQKTNLTPEDFTPRSKRLLEMAIVKSRVMGQNYVGTEHILIVMGKEPDCYGVKLLAEMGSSPEALISSMLESIGAEVGEAALLEKARRSPPPRVGHRPAGSTQTLERYGRDLTEQARLGLLDPVIGREGEVSRLIQILSRRSKNNPCLVGEAGVGKTAIVEGLAQKIVDAGVPESLRDKRLVTLDLSAMVAGAKYRGDFEDRVKSVLEEVSSDREIILFIDELHTIIGAGAAEGAIDAANILKPQLARGEIQLIGATTIAEFRKHIEKDAALERRFQPVTVDEPSEDAAIEILRGILPRYEAHHKLRITDDAVMAAVTLSAKYIPDRYLPDKAIDLIDEAASRVRLRAFTSPASLGALEQKLAEYKGEKREAIGQKNFELAGEIRGQERALAGKISQLRGGWTRCDSLALAEAVTKEEVAELIADITGIEVTTLTQEQSKRLINLEDDLRLRIVGQTEAVSAVASAIRRGKVGLKDPRRPIGSFIFLGPTGVGKTELCLALAETLFAKQDSLIRLDMSEYMEKHTVAKLIGSPPGYVGYGEGGQLTEKVRRKPYSVLLFDEIEKAHPDIWSILLQILEDGRLTDSQGRVVSFKNTVIIMTSNAGARQITEQRTLGFTGSQSGQSDAAMKKDVMGELGRLFKPEFLNRVDEIIIFDKLSREEVREIARKMFTHLSGRAKEMGIGLDFTEQAVSQISEEGFDLIYGARPLRRAVQRKIEDKLADKILKGQVLPGESILCDFDGEFVFKKQLTVNN